MRHLLARLRLGIGIAAGAHACHEDPHLMDFPGLWVGDRNGISGIVHKQLFTGFVVLPHGRIELLGIASVQITILAISVSSRMGFPVLRPQQPQSHAPLLQFPVNYLPIRQNLSCRFVGNLLRKQQPVQHVLVQPIRHWPFQPHSLGPLQIFGTVQKW